MIKSITLDNFQSHDSSEVDLGPGVTVLVGSSNVGKTAILRGLRWITENRPRGTGMIRTGEKEATVTVETTDGDVIERSRTKTKNRYTLNTEILEAMGADVPTPVQAALPLGDLNLAHQLDPHFLVLAPPSQIANTINDALHLEKARAVANRLASNLRTTRTDLKATQGESLEAQEALQALEGVEAYRQAVKTAETLKTAHKSARQEFLALGTLLDNIDRANQDLKGLGIPPNAAEMISKAEEAQRDVEATRRLTGTLRFVLTGLAGNQADLDDIPEMPDLTAMEGHIRTNAAKCDHILRELSDLRDTVLDLDEIEKTLAEMENKLHRATERYTELRAEIRVCPVCGHLLTDE